MKILNIITSLTLLAILLLGCQARSTKKAEPVAAEVPLEETAANPAATVTDTPVAAEEPLEVIADASLPDAERNYVSIKDEIGKHKITLLDFWASWCGPCRETAPIMVDLYQRYKGQGLGIIGISLDEDFDEWQEAIEELGLPWLQLSELRGWDDTLVGTYQIQAIPRVMAVNSKGEILSSDIDVTDLEAFLQKRL